MKDNIQLSVISNEYGIWCIGMDYKKIRKELRKYGYTRRVDYLSKLSYNPVIKMNFSNRSLNHTRLLDSDVIKTNFNFAAMTGSYFKSCKFIN